MFIVCNNDILIKIFLKNKKINIFNFVLNKKENQRTRNKIQAKEKNLVLSKIKERITKIIKTIPKIKRRFSIVKK